MLLHENVLPRGSSAKMKAMRRDAVRYVKYVLELPMKKIAPRVIATDIALPVRPTKLVAPMNLFIGKLSDLIHRYCIRGKYEKVIED